MKYEVENPMTWSEMICGVMLLLVLFVLVPGVAGYIEHSYERENCVVVAVQGNEVVAEDELGYEWSWYVDDEENIMEGDVVTLKMHTAFTHNTIDDDEVRNYKIQK
jgi:hypothetical protein